MAYHAQPIISSYITKIVPGTPEADVDHLWSNLLACYLPGTQNFGLEREAYIQSRSRTRANVCVSTLVRGSMSKVIMAENKRASRSQSGSPASSSWTHAKDQLLGYMVARRAEQTENLPRQFGIVGIGRYVKFFELQQLNHQLQNYGNGSTYKLDVHYLAIKQVIQQIKAYIVSNRH